MKLRHLAFALCTAGVLAVSVNQSQAAPASSVAYNAGKWATSAAGGVIIVATVLCIYDLWLKANGLKNWDGSKKKKGQH